MKFMAGELGEGDKKKRGKTGRQAGTQAGQGGQTDRTQHSIGSTCPSSSRVKRRMAQRDWMASISLDDTLQASAKRVVFEYSSCTFFLIFFIYLFFNYRFEEIKICVHQKEG